MGDGAAARQVDRFTPSLRVTGTSRAIADHVSDEEQAASGFDAPPVVIGHSMGGFKNPFP
jgi:alpha-beta hydrolase superfamily lysophospholipase